MIDPALLDRLQKADPATYYAAKDAISSRDFGLGPRDWTKPICDPIELWILQGVLQDAIQARGWPHITEYDPNTQKYDVSIMAGDRVYSGYAKESSSAILHAYLAAIEVNHP